MNSGVVGGFTNDERSTGIRSDEHDPSNAGRFHHVINGVSEVVHPSLQREVTGRLATTTKRECHCDVLDLVGESIYEFGESACGTTSIERADRKAVAQNKARSVVVYGRWKR